MIDDEYQLTYRPSKGKRNERERVLSVFLNGFCGFFFTLNIERAYLKKFRIFILNNNKKKLTLI